MEEEVPIWCILRKIPIELSPEEALDFAKERIDRFARREFWDLRERERTESSEAITREFAGHVLLRIVVSQDPRLSAWLVEFEGDLFDYRFRKAEEEEIMAVLRYFFNQDKGDQDKVMKLEDIEKTLGLDLKKKYGLIEIREFLRRDKKQIRASDGRIIIKREQRTEPVPKGLRKYVGIHFTKVPTLVAKRKTLLINGWAIAPIFVFRLAAKRAFEERLREKLQETQEKIKADKSLRPIVRELRDYLAIHEKDFILPSQTEISPTGRLFQQVELVPECMNQLLSILTETGHLAHGERLQLGLFLKKLGMSLEEQKGFWYKHAVDNIGMTFEEFDSKVGYTIDHLYGKAGSGTDYEAMKCETIITSYYCAFAQKGADEIMKRIQKEFEEKPTNFDQILEDLMTHMINNEPQNACAKLFELRYGKKAKKTIHPISYTLYAAKVLKEKKEKVAEEKKTTDVKENLDE